MLFHRGRSEAEPDSRLQTILQCVNIFSMFDIFTQIQSTILIFVSKLQIFQALFKFLFKMFEKTNSGQEQDLFSNPFFEFLMLLNGRFFHQNSSKLSIWIFRSILIGWNSQNLQWSVDRVNSKTKRFQLILS